MPPERVAETTDNLGVAGRLVRAEQWLLERRIVAAHRPLLPALGVAVAQTSVCSAAARRCVFVVPPVAWIGPGLAAQRCVELTVEAGTGAAWDNFDR